MYQCNYCDGIFSQIHFLVRVLSDEMFWASFILMGSILYNFVAWYVIPLDFNFDLVVKYNYNYTRKPASRVFLAPPEGLTKFLSSLYHAWQLLLAKFFDLVKLEFWPPGSPEPPGGKGSNLNSLFPALWWEG